MVIFKLYLEPIIEKKESISSILIQPKQLNELNTINISNKSNMSFFQYNNEECSNLFGSLIHSNYNPSISSHQLLNNRFTLPPLFNPPDLMDRLIKDDEETIYNKSDEIKSVETFVNNAIIEIPEYDKDIIVKEEKSNTIKGKKKILRWNSNEKTTKPFTMQKDKLYGILIIIYRFIT